jgi:structural maintenance of chromosome 3 (chondroitin sulfate proteoglycan 6)
MQLEKQQTEKYFGRKALILKKKDDAMKKIRDLGALPEEAFQKFQDTSIQQVGFGYIVMMDTTNARLVQLITNLHKANESLKKYSHVNKKAYEQYLSFTKQREQLDERKDELNASAKVSAPDIELF